MRLTDLLERLDRRVTYYADLCPVMGGVNATILLCQLISWTGSERDPEGWIYKKNEELTTETGLSRREQDTARARLLELGLVEIKRAGQPPILHYRVNKEAVNQAWESHCTNSPLPLHPTKSTRPKHETASSKAQKRRVLHTADTSSSTNEDEGPPPDLVALAADRPPEWNIVDWTHLVMTNPHRALQLARRRRGLTGD